MAKYISILLDDHLEAFIDRMIKSGKFLSAGEVVQSALSMFENREEKKAELIMKLKTGEKSGYVTGFNPNTFIEDLHKKYTQTQ